MSEDAFAQTLPTVAARRAAAVAQLRDLATRLEQLPLDAVAEVLVLLEPTLDDLRRQAALALECSPVGRSRWRTRWIAASVGCGGAASERFVTG